MSPDELSEQIRIVDALTANWPAWRKNLLADSSRSYGRASPMSRQKIRDGGIVIGHLRSALVSLEAAIATAKTRGPGEARAEIEAVLKLAKLCAANVEAAYDSVGRPLSE